MKVSENQTKEQSSRALSDIHSGRGSLHIEDNRVSQQKAAQFKTEIQYQTGTLGDFDVGEKMHTFLDPTDPVHGSEPGTKVQKELMSNLKGRGYKAMVRGHLLNAELGGLGIAANLFPITSQANSQHKMTVENPVKEFLRDTGKYGIGEENRLEYSVEVRPIDDRPAVIFHCEVGSEEGNELLTNDITSEPEAGTTGSGSASVTTSKSFKNSDLPKGWGHIGKGYKAENEFHQATMNHTQIFSHAMETDEGIDGTTETDEGIDEFGIKQYLFDIWGSSDLTLHELFSMGNCPWISYDEELYSRWMRTPQEEQAGSFNDDAVNYVDLNVIENYIMFANNIPALKVFADFWRVEFEF